MVTKVFVEWTLLKARWKFEIIMRVLTKLSRWKFEIIMRILAKLLILNQSDSQWPITTKVYNTTSQWEFVLIARDRPQAGENAFDQGAVGLVLRVIDVRAVCGVISLEPITEHDEATPMQSCDTFDSQLEIFQIWNASFDLTNGINRALFWQNPLQETLVIKFTCRWSNPRTHLFQSVHLLPSLATACWDWMRGEFTRLNPLALKSD